MSSTDTCALQDALATVAQADVLTACEDTPLTRGEIADRVDCSRATVYRATTTLNENGFLEQTPDGFLTTQRGTVVLEAANRILGSMTAIDRLDPLVSQCQFERTCSARASARRRRTRRGDRNQPVPGDRPRDGSLEEFRPDSVWDPCDWLTGFRR